MSRGVTRAHAYDGSGLGRLALASRIFCEVNCEAALSADTPDGSVAPLRMPEARAVVAIASARGGVGKTALCVNLAATLAIAGRRVAIVDADLNSPGILAMLGMRPLQRFSPGEEIEPATGPLGLRVVSSALLADGEPSAFSFLADDEAAPASANGMRPLELDLRATMRRLLGAHLGPLDVVLVDLASGLAQLHYLARIAELAGVVMVTQPSDAAVRATREAMEILGHMAVPVLGLIENMLGFSCDSCHAVRPLFPRGDLASLERGGAIPVLGRLPFDPRLAECCERGTLFVREHADAPAARQFGLIATALEREIARHAARQPSLGASS